MVRIKSDLMVSDLILPGSYNSASYMVRPGKRVKCLSLNSSSIYQRDSIYCQLKKGIRILHIRVMVDKQTNRLRTFSNSQNIDFDAVLKQLKAFLVVSKDVVFIRLIASESAVAVTIKNLLCSALPDAMKEISSATVLNSTRLEDLFKADTRLVLISCPVRTTTVDQITPPRSGWSEIERFDTVLYRKPKSWLPLNRVDAKVKFNKTFDEFVSSRGNDYFMRINAILFDFATCYDIVSRLIFMNYLKCGLIK